MEPPRSGAMHFVTADEDKARAEASVDPDKRHLLIFEDGELSSGDAPTFILNSARRKEAQRLALEQQLGPE